MFPDIGGVELIIVAVVALLVVKPKDLPVMMRKVGEFMGKARRMASDFRASFEDMARQTELDDLRKQVEDMRSKAADPMGLTSALNETGQEIEASLNSDADFDYGYAPEPEPEPAPVEAAAPKKRAAPKKAATAKAATPKSAKPKAASRKPAATVSEANPKRARAKSATKTVS